jgi:two-component system KDP operon response regulator KdpE
MPQAKILVVDDDPDLVRAMRLRLLANNYEVLPCAMAMAQSAQKDRPSLDRSRFGLPVGDGFVVLERLQNSDTLAGVPVIVLGARRSPE